MGIPFLPSISAANAVATSSAVVANENVGTMPDMVHLLVGWFEVFLLVQATYMKTSSAITEKESPTD